MLITCRFSLFLNGNNPAIFFGKIALCSPGPIYSDSIKKSD